ncbi:MAG: hypothetical protein FWB85_00815 [Chitinispirillia bacterium]|nr:hypothetical protein [Chitinispirillia bacterium]MCL2241043.1 hypothetical protein [Chitinispirillia bacterium]
MIRRKVMAFLLTAAVSLFAQSEGAYGGGGSSAIDNGDGGAKYTGLLDPARFSINHSMSFMAGGSQVSDVKSQSFYSTMMQYRFNAPVVLSLNFDMPIHSTFNQYNNFTTDNLQSLDYFRNMPFDASVTWMPSERFLFRVSMIKAPESGYYSGPGYFYRRDPFSYRGW